MGPNIFIWGLATFSQGQGYVDVRCVFMETFFCLLQVAIAVHCRPLPSIAVHPGSLGPSIHLGSLGPSIHLGSL